MGNIFNKHQGSPVSSKAEKNAVFSTVFSTWKKQFLPVSSTEIRKKLKNEVYSVFFAYLFEVSLPSFIYGTLY